MLTLKLLENRNFVLYGAQVVAYGAYMAIKHLYKRVPECFVVSSPDNNPTSIDGIAVRTIKAVPSDMLVIIAVTELFQQEIAANLHSNNYQNIFRLTARAEHSLMSDFFTSIGLFPLAEKKDSGTVNFSLYETRHHHDKLLRTPPSLESWEIPIQAGAALTDNRVCDQLDNIGNNISHKNRQFCEASVMYWVWKNAKSQWVGIEHYRRHLLVNPNMLDNEIDAIMPLPYLCYPNTLSQFTRFVGEGAAQVLVSALRKLYPSEYDRYYQCLQEKYHYAYNLTVAKRAVFSNYCRWVFSITDYIESLGIDIIINSRALAYMVEQLTSIYFIANSERLNIKHAEKAIYT